MITDLQNLNWHSAFEKTLLICENDSLYASYSVREKMLAFSFTFIQTISENVHFFSNEIKQNRLTCLRHIKKDVMSYFETLLLEGSNSGEIQSRLYVSNYYTNVCWNMLISMLNFWQQDKSFHKERTDVFIEKSVHFTMDLLAPNAIDSGFDLLQQFIKWRK